MKNKVIRIAVLALILSGANFARAEGQHLFILSGQSNMARLDEKVSFVPTIESELGTESVIVVKDAQGGQPIRRWYKKWEPTGKQNAPGDLYDRLMAKVKEATRNQELDSITVLWMQGERDAKEGNGDRYRASLEGLLAQFESDLGRKDIHLVVGRLSDFGVGKVTDWETIRKAQRDLAESSEMIAWVDTDDLNDVVGKDGTTRNDLHYTKEGYRIFGERLAKAAILLIRSKR